MGVIFYLSDPSYRWIKDQARQEELSTSRWVELHYPDLVSRRLCIKDSGLIELIAARSIDPSTQSVIERGDKPIPYHRAPIEYDGVVWQAMFGSWGRLPRELGVSEDAVGALAAWTVREKVVRRRAATQPTLASEALELIGRGWTCSETSDD